MTRGLRLAIRPSPRAATLAALAVLGGCGQLVQYTDELTDDRTGRTAFVTTPATLGGVVGFVVGLPVDVVALPVTYPFYAYQKSQDPAKADPLSIMLFPSFVLWRTGTLIAAPIDLVESAVYRSWRSPETLTREEREEIEFYHDDHLLPSYPVTPIYPDPDPDRSEHSDRQPGAAKGNAAPSSERMP